jgi:hypothetical protein
MSFRKNWQRAHTRCGGKNTAACVAGDSKRATNARVRTKNFSIQRIIVARCDHNTRAIDSIFLAMWRTEHAAMRASQSA